MRFCGWCGERLMAAEQLLVMGVRDEGPGKAVGADHTKLLDS